MARKPRLHYPGAYYHVMLRGNGGMQIFYDQDDREKFYDLLEETVVRFEYRIHAFCLMTNHVHFVIQVGESSLSKIIQNISFRYTRYINNKMERIGHLFQGRYKAQHVNADNYLLQLIRYIHLNPLRADMVVNLHDYPWSSHLAYLGRAKISWLTKQSVFNLLTQNKRRAIADYLQFILNQSDELVENFPLSIQKSFPEICDDQFMLKLSHLQRIEEFKINLTLTKLVVLICEYYAIDEVELHDKSRRQLTSKIRLITAMLAAEFKLANLTEIAAYFNRDVSTFSRGLSKWSESVDVEFNAVRRHIESATMQA